MKSRMSADEIMRLLASALPQMKLSSGNAEFRIPGAPVSALTARPESAEQVAAILELAQQLRWSIAPAGGGTMLELGSPIRGLDLLIDLRDLNKIVDYQPDDLTLTVEAGTTLEAIGLLLEARGQSLPLDVPLPARATLGGALAANASGPRRLRYGTGRDLVIGMQAALPGGTLARSGGRVVKNVAGYDLGKMHIGALGTLGVITEVTLKLWPAPAATAVETASFASFGDAASAASALFADQLFPAAVEIVGPGALASVSGRADAGAGAERWELVVLFEGLAAAVKRQASECRALTVTRGGAPEPALDPASSVALLADLRDFGRAPGSESLLLKASVLPSQCELAIQALQSAGARLEQPPQVSIRPGAGLVFALWQNPALERLSQAVNQARSVIVEAGGALTIERQPASGHQVDAWGFDAPDLALMRRLKAVFDPEGILNPGRFVGEL